MEPQSPQEIHIITPDTIPLLNPKEVLPTSEMIEQGKRDFLATTQTLARYMTPSLPKGETFDLLTSPHQQRLRGAFMGFTAETASFASILHTLKEANEIKDILATTTQNRLDLVFTEDSEFPGGVLHNSLINLAAARRIMSAYSDIFPVEAAVDPVQWINSILRKKDINRDVYMGLLSGFPPMSVRLYSDKSRKGQPKNILGIGQFNYYGTQEEDNYIQAVEELYKGSEVESLVTDLKRDYHLYRS